MCDSYEVVRKMHTLAAPLTLSHHISGLAARISVLEIIRQHLTPLTAEVVYECVCAVNPALNNRYDDCLSN